MAAQESGYFTLQEVNRLKIIQDVIDRRLVCGKFKAIESTISAAKYRNSEHPKGYLR